MFSHFIPFDPADNCVSHRWYSKQKQPKLADSRASTQFQQQCSSSLILALGATLLSFSSLQSTSIGLNYSPQLAEAARDGNPLLEQKYSFPAQASPWTAHTMAISALPSDLVCWYKEATLKAQQEFQLIVMTPRTLKQLKREASLRVRRTTKFS